MAATPRSPSSTRSPRKSSASTSPAQADVLRRTREDHSHEVAEDYVEAIADLVARTGEARVVDLARQLGVSHVTVNRTIARLQRTGYVTSQPYRAIFLTETGRKVAEVSKQRHQTVVEFLGAIGVPEPIARRDAEGIEHHVSPETLAAMERHLTQATKPRRGI